MDLAGRGSGGVGPVRLFAGAGRLSPKLRLGFTRAAERSTLRGDGSTDGESGVAVGGAVRRALLAAHGWLRARFDELCSLHPDN